MSEYQAMDCFVRLLDAMEVVHENGKLHLNVAPSNVVVGDNGMVELINPRKDGDSYNPGYTPLEVMTTNVAAQGPWSDIYGLGATLYNMLTGKQPPEADDIISAGNNAFDFAGVSGLMQQLIGKMMSPSRKQRPQSVGDVWLLISTLAKNVQPNSAPQAPAIEPNMPQSTPVAAGLPQPAPAMPNAPHPSPAPQPIPVAPVSPPRQPQPYYGRVGQEKKSGSRLGLFVLAGVLIIAAIAGAAVMFWPNGGKTTNKIENTSDTSKNSKTDNPAAIANTDNTLTANPVATEEPANDEAAEPISDEAVEPTNDLRQNHDAAVREAQEREAEKKRKAEEEKKRKAEEEKKQKAEQKNQQPTTNKVLDVAPVMPSFPGGDNKVMEFINSHKHNPTGEKGVVAVQFVVNKNGSLSNFKVLNSKSPELAQEALRVCKMLPKFNPGRDEQGNPVNVKYTVPVRF